MTIVSAGIINGQEGPQVYEDFSDGDLSNYEGATGDYSISSAQSRVGTNSLLCETQNTNPIYRSDDKPGPERGGTFEVFYRNDGTAGQNIFNLHFAVDPANNGNSYLVEFDMNGGSLDVFRYDNGSGTELGDTSLDRFGETFQWNKATVDFGETTPGDIQVTVTNPSGTELGSLTVTDSTYDTGTFGWWIQATDADPDQLYMDGLQDVGA